MSIDIVQGGILNDQRHQRSGEEEAERVLESKRVLFLILGGMHLVLCNGVQDGRDDELVDEYDGEDEAVDDDQRRKVQLVGGGLAGGALVRVLEDGGLELQEEVDGDCDDCDQQHSEHPTNYLPDPASGSVDVDVLPDDLVRLRCLHHHHLIRLLVVEQLPQRLNRLLILHLLAELAEKLLFFGV